METNPSSPGELAAWCARQIEYVARILDTYDLSRWIDGMGPPRKRPEENPDWSEDTRAGNRVRAIDGDLRRLAAQLCSAETVRSLAKLESAFRQADELLVNLKAVREWCEADVKAEGPDDSAWVRAASIWTKHRDRFATGKVFKRYLEHHPEIRFRHKGQRLEVHSGDWQRHVDAGDKARLEALEISQEAADATLEVLRKKKRRQ